MWFWGHPFQDLRISCEIPIPRPGRQLPPMVSLAFSAFSRPIGRGNQVASNASPSVAVVDVLGTGILWFWELEISGGLGLEWFGRVWLFAPLKDLAGCKRDFASSGLKHAQQNIKTWCMWNLNSSSRQRSPRSGVLSLNQGLTDACTIHIMSYI
jgi:hypothetical protein